MTSKGELLLNPALFTMPVTKLLAKQPDHGAVDPFVLPEKPESGPPKKSLCTILYIYCLFLLAFFLLSIGLGQVLTAITGSPASLRTAPVVPNVHVVFSGTSDVEDLLRIVFAAQHWRNFGVRAVVMLAANENEVVEGPRRLLFNTLMEMESHVAFVPARRLDARSLAQLLPFYISATKVAVEQEDDAIFVVASTDYLPLELANHLPVIEKGIRVKLYDTDLGEMVHFGELKLQKYGLNTVALTTVVWREVFGLPEEMTLADIETDFLNRYADDIIGGESSVSSRLQQLSFGANFDQWKVKNTRTHDTFRAEAVTSVFPHSDIRRLDAKFFVSRDSSILRKIPLSTYHDISIDDRYYDDQAWRQAGYIFKRLFTPTQFDYMLQVRERVMSWTSEERQREWTKWMQLNMGDLY